MSHFPSRAKPPRNSSQQHQPQRVALLTGATGFVGGELLQRLVDDPERRIVCFVRAASDDEAAARGAATLRRVLGRTPSAAESARVEWLRADLGQPGLGLRPTQRWSLARRLFEVFHCAASVSFDSPLEEAQRVNVDGVRHLVELAAEAGPRLRRFHHVSTAYVAGRTRKRVGGDYLPSDRASNFRNTYERTKARAERYLRTQRHVPVTVYRPSIIAGDTRTGRTTNWNVVYVPMRQIAHGQLPFLRCGGRALVDTVGIDFVVDGMLALSKREVPHGTTFLLTASHRAFDVRQYIEACTAGIRRRGGNETTSAVSPASWWLRTRMVSLLAHVPSRFRKLRAIGLGVQRGLRSFQPYEPYTSVDVEFAVGDEHRFLAARGIQMPPAEEYLQTIVDFALRDEFGRAEARAEAAEIQPVRAAASTSLHPVVPAPPAGRGELEMPLPAPAALQPSVFQRSFAP